MPNNPQNRKVWLTSDLEAGEYGSFDQGQASHRETCRETIPFGVFVEKQSGIEGIIKFTNAPTTLYGVGVSMISNIAKNYGEREYLESEVAEVGLRGNVIVKIDPNDPPDPTIIGASNIFISYKAGIEGALAGSAATARTVDGIVSGIKIIRVGAEVAEVYLSGKPVFTA